MSGAPPIVCQYDGEAFYPLKRFRRECDDRFVVGERYVLEEVQQRSAASHRFYFAALNECWQSLPEHLAPRFPTSEHLRKHALIKAGYRDERSIVCASKAEAQRVAAFVRPMDDYAIVMVSGAIVTQYTAKSQSMKAMGKEAFRESMDAVLNVLAEMIGSDVSDVVRHAREAA